MEKRGEAVDKRYEKERYEAKEWWKKEEEKMRERERERELNRNSGTEIVQITIIAIINKTTNKHTHIHSIWQIPTTYPFCVHLTV